jgi:hypothetical protein
MTIRIAVAALAAAMLVAVSARADEAEQNPKGDMTVLLPEATVFFAALMCTHALPPLGPQDHGSLQMMPVDLTGPETQFPFRVKVSVSPMRTPKAKFWYAIQKKGPSEPWAMLKAWKTNPDGKKLADLPIPSKEVQSKANEAMMKTESNQQQN